MGCVALAVCAPAKGDVVELGATMPGYFEASVASYQVLSQEFSIAQPIYVNDVLLFMSGYGTDQFNFWLTNDIDPGASDSNVILEASATFPNSGGALNAQQQITGDWVSIPLDLELYPGNYFITLDSAQTNVGQGWVGALPSSIIATSVGTVGAALYATPPCGTIDSAFAPASSFEYLDATTYEMGVPYFDTPYLFEVVVPEPPAVIYLGTIVGFFALKRCRGARRGHLFRVAQRTACCPLDASATTCMSGCNTANSKLEQISGDVSGVMGDVKSAQSVLEQHGSELKRVTGDMGVMSGLIATNSKELAELRELGDRNYLEFDLKRSSTAQKIGGIQLQLAKADPKRNRFTLDVVADDKRVEKKDRTINEPVQLYVAGNRQPYEIVVNNVKKDEVTGYLAVPKVTMARR
jgi:hypothetical protein